MSIEEIPFDDINWDFTLSSEPPSWWDPDRPNWNEAILKILSESCPMAESRSNLLKGVSKFCSKTWEGGCKIAHKTAKKVKQIWEDHKTEVIVAVVVVAAAATIIYTFGTGTNAAIAAGTAAVGTLANGPSTERPPMISSSSEPPSLPKESTSHLYPSENFPQSPSLALNDTPSIFGETPQGAISPPMPISIFELDRMMRTSSQGQPPTGIKEDPSLPSELPIPYYPKYNTGSIPEYRPPSSSSDIPSWLKWEQQTSLNNNQPLSIPNSFSSSHPEPQVIAPSIDTTRYDPEFLLFLEKFSPNYFDPNPKVEKSWVDTFVKVMGKGMIDTELQEALSACPKPIPSSHYIKEGTQVPHIRIGGINGMNTPHETMTSHTNYLSQFIPDHRIEWVHNQTHGPIIDLGEIFSFNYPGSSPNTADLLIENWTKFHQENRDYPNAKYLQFCHSQGAIHINNGLEQSSEEMRNRIIVVAIAPAKVVPTEMCYRSYNYASKKDIVPYGEVVYAAAKDANNCLLTNNVEKAIENRKQLILLDPHPDATGIDHDWQSPTFLKTVKDHIDAYLTEYGEHK